MNLKKKFSNLLAYHTGPLTHLDHLGVLCIELGLPLVTSDPLAFETAKTQYPELQIALIEEIEALSLLAQCDVLFGCGKFWASSLKEELRLIFRKFPRMVFCPHGNSDKGRTLSEKDVHPTQDIVLFYGEQMRDLWKNTGALKSTFTWLFTGNYRYSYYLKRKVFYDQLAAPFFARFVPERKTIFYAPTWPDKENPTPVSEACDPLIAHLGTDFQLLIKLHPLLMEQFPSQTQSLIERHKNTPFVQILTDFAPIYPLLARSDLYLGDFSSIGYDALAFDLPLYFLVGDRQSLKTSDLANAGICFETPAISDLGRLIAASLETNKRDYKAKREKLYTYAFGEVQEGKTILKELLDQLQE